MFFAPNVGYPVGRLDTPMTAISLLLVPSKKSLRFKSVGSFGLNPVLRLGDLLAPKRALLYGADSRLRDNPMDEFRSR